MHCKKAQDSLAKKRQNTKELLASLYIIYFDQIFSISCLKKPKVKRCHESRKFTRKQE